MMLYPQSSVSFPTPTLTTHYSPNPDHHHDINLQNPNTPSKKSTKQRILLYFKHKYKINGGSSETVFARTSAALSCLLLFAGLRKPNLNR